MPELSSNQEVELERRQAEERALWLSAAECGCPYSEADQIWAMVHLEMQYYCGDEAHALSVAGHARAWIETRNPFHIDLGVHICSVMDIRPPPALATLVAEVAGKRLRGELSSGTPDKIFRDGTRDHALTFMANLRAAGLSMDAAASKAAALLFYSSSPTLYAASSLQKLYSDRFRRLEAVLRQRFSTDRGADQLAQWRNLIPKLHDAPPHLIGERR